MCFFITIAVRVDAVEAVRAAHAVAGLLIDRTSNPAAFAAAGTGWVPLLVTGGGCSCAWYVRPKSVQMGGKIARAKKKYERMGWSAAKIARAVASMQSGPRPEDGLHITMIELLTAIASHHGAVRVWVHDFRGKVETEPYVIVRSERWTLAQLPAKAAILDTDVIAEIAG